MRTKLTMQDRFWAKVNKTESCWLWTACTGRRGHGYFGINGKNRAAHRVAYEMLVGPIPPGLTLDHLCRQPACVNPAHLEPVDNRTNVLRGIGPTAQNARKTHCKRGHSLTSENIYRRGNGRQCKLCCRDRYLRLSQGVVRRRRH